MESSNGLLTKNQVAKRLSVSPSTITRWAKQGKLQYVKLEGKKKNKRGHNLNSTIRFREEHVEEFLKEHAVHS